MKHSELEDLIRKKLTILDTSHVVFYKAVKDIEENLLKKVIAYLKRFTTKSGKLDRKSRSNKNLLIEFNKQIKRILFGSKLKKETGKFLKNFDEIENISLDILKGVNGIDIKKLKLSTEKKLAVEAITDGLLKGTSLNREIGKPIRKILYRHVTRGTSISVAEKELKAFIAGSNGKLGKVSGYVRQIATDTLNRYDGTINQKASDEFDMDGFRFIGSLIETSRTNCIQMVDGTGSLGKFKKNGKYRKKDIKKIIAIAKNRPGWKAGTNESNYFINRNGYSCRHTIIPTILLSKDKDSFDENVN